MQNKVEEVLSLPISERREALNEAGLDLVEFAKELKKLSDGKTLGLMGASAFSKFPDANKKQAISAVLKQFPEVAVDTLALDREFEDQEDRMAAIASDLENEQIPNHRLHEILYENFFDPYDKKSRMFFGKYLRVRMSPMFFNELKSIFTQLKSTLGEKQFVYYLATPMLLGDGRKVTIYDLCLKDYGFWNVDERKALTEDERRHLEELQPKEEGRAVVNRGNIDTHQVSTHKSADESHVAAFKRMLEREAALSGVEVTYTEPAKEGHKPRELQITNRGALDGFLTAKNQELQARINAVVSMDNAAIYNEYLRYRDIEKFKGIEYKDLSEAEKAAFDEKIAGFRFQAAAAKRFMDDMIAHHSSGRGTYNYNTNSKATCGLTMEEMVAASYYACSDIANFHDGVTEKTAFLGLVGSIYDMRRGYNIDHGDDKPNENKYPIVDSNSIDNNRCHGGSVNSLANGLSKLHKSYEVKLILRDDIEREIQNIYTELVNNNLELFEGQEEVIAAWNATGKITGKPREALKAKFEAEHRAAFIADYQGYIADDSLYSIIDQGLDGIEIPEAFKKKSALESMGAGALY